MRVNKDIVKIASVIVAIVLGAGFATGQELMSFFVRFGQPGFAGILIAGCLFAAASWAVLYICNKKNIRSYNEFMLVVCGKKLSAFMETSVALFMFVLFSTMLSAGGEVGRAAFGLPFFFGAAVMGGLCVLTLAAGVDGFVKINAVLAPIMIAGAVLIGIYTLIFESMPVFLQELPLMRSNWAFSAVLYASYNMLTAISVLCSLSEMAKGKRASISASLLAGAVIALLAVCMSLPLFLNYQSLLDLEIPMLRVARSYGTAIEYVYLLILFAAVFTTAVANGFAFVEWLKSNFNVCGLAVKIIMVIAALLCSHAGFSNFVTIFYPLFGYIGLLELALIFICVLLLRRRDFTHYRK